jgi:hypothetical protein
MHTLQRCRDTALLYETQLHVQQQKMGGTHLQWAEFRRIVRGANRRGRQAGLWRKSSQHVAGSTFGSSPQECACLRNEKHRIAILGCAGIELTDMSCFCLTCLLVSFLIQTSCRGVACLEYGSKMPECTAAMIETDKRLTREVKRNMLDCALPPKGLGLGRPITAVEHVCKPGARDGTKDQEQGAALSHQQTRRYQNVSYRFFHRQFIL